MSRAVARFDDGRMPYSRAAIAEATGGRRRRSPAPRRPRIGRPRRRGRGATSTSPGCALVFLEAREDTRPAVRVLAGVRACEFHYVGRRRDAGRLTDPAGGAMLAQRPARSPPSTSAISLPPRPCQRFINLPRPQKTSRSRTLPPATSPSPRAATRSAPTQAHCQRPPLLHPR
jgi:hypothetical protein